MINVNLEYVDNNGCIMEITYQQKTEKDINKLIDIFLENHKRCTLLNVTY